MDPPPLHCPPHFAPAGCRWLGAPTGGSGVPCSTRTRGGVVVLGSSPVPLRPPGGGPWQGGAGSILAAPSQQLWVPAPPVPRARPPEPCQQLGARGKGEIPAASPGRKQFGGGEGGVRPPHPNHPRWPHHLHRGAERERFPEGVVVFGEGSQGSAMLRGGAPGGARSCPPSVGFSLLLQAKRKLDLEGLDFRTPKGKGRTLAQLPSPRSKLGCQGGGAEGGDTPISQGDGVAGWGRRSGLFLGYFSTSLGIPPGSATPAWPAPCRLHPTLRK